MAEEKNKVPLGSAPIAFGKRLAGSETFKAMFREGMALVEETATYLDGDGRQQSRSLAAAGRSPTPPSSMRLTTRLMQLASWLLLQRAVNEGEMSAERPTARSRRSSSAASPAPPTAPPSTTCPSTCAT